MLLLLDDYGLYAPPDIARLAIAREVLLNDLSVGSVRLTANRLPNPRKYETRADSELVIFPQWMYTINAQAGLWRRSSLLRILQLVGPMNPWSFEIKASHLYNTVQVWYEKHLGFAKNHTAPDFLDADPNKPTWVLPYHNLSRQGNVDPRHFEFLARHGIQL
jgi:hypothetical protein